MFKLHFENRVYSTAKDFEVNSHNLPDFAKTAFSFCQSWLEGEYGFSITTSGSTGRPKQLTISRQQMEASARATGAFFNIDSHARLLCCLNPSFIAGKMMLVRAMVWNCDVRLVEPDSRPLQDLEENFDFVALVPIQIQTLIAEKKNLKKLQTIKNLIIGGAPISNKLKNEITQSGLRAWQTFGMTETVSHIALAKIGESELIYQILPGVKIGQDSRGALWVESEMNGYDRIQTNDLIELRSDHSFVWLGRADFVINSGGIKLFPEMMEQKAAEVVNEVFPEIRFFFFGEKDEHLGEKLVLVLETAESSSRLKILKDRLTDVLGKYELPKKIYFSKGFTLTENGKINRRISFQNL